MSTKFDSCLVALSLTFKEMYIVAKENEDCFTFLTLSAKVNWKKIQSTGLNGFEHKRNVTVIFYV